MGISSYKVLSSTANKLSFKYLKKFIALALRPIDYTRTKEIPIILDVSKILEEKTGKIRILDIGSPQILSLSLAQFSKNWEITYINPFKDEIDDLAGKSLTLGLNNVDIYRGDITDFNTLSALGKFDYIFSCSVFEHIHPEDGGDIIASQNVTKLLKSGGIFSVSVPYYKKGFKEYKGGDVYAVKAREGGETFFQRFYDEMSLMKQIIEPSGLKVMEKLYVGERYYFSNNVHKRMAHFIGVGKKSYLVGRIFKNISDLFMTISRDAGTLTKPYLVIVSLRKD